MAFSSGSEGFGGFNTKKYIGIASVTLDGINTTLNTDKNFSYVTTNEDGTKSVRIELMLNAAPENNEGLSAIIPISMFLRNVPRYNSTKTKVQVIDEFGRTAWVTNEEYKAKKIPVYANGTAARITNNYRMCYSGEEDLTNFFKTYVHIPSYEFYDNGTWAKRDPNKCYARFDDLDKLFLNNFSELNNIWSEHKSNKIKVLLGVRTVNSNFYQAMYTRMFLRDFIKDYSRLETEVVNAQNAGGYPNTEFKIAPVTEYVIAPTNLVEPAAVVDNPFASANGSQSNPFTAKQEAPAASFGGDIPGMEPAKSPWDDNDDDSLPF